MTRPALPFADRAEAGRALAAVLATRLAGAADDVIVLALPRGGVPVGAEVAHALGAPLDAFVVRKLGVPGHEEFAFGAIASGGVRVLDDAVVRALRLDDAVVDRITRAESAELARRERLYRGDRPPPALRGRTAIVVDDGVATGSTLRAAVAALRAFAPARLVVAVPVGARAACARLRTLADDVACVLEPPDFDAVGAWYRDFAQVEDDAVRALLGAVA